LPTLRYRAIVGGGVPDRERRSFCRGFVCHLARAGIAQGYCIAMSPSPERDRPTVVGAVQEKLNEFQALVAPVERAIKELQFSQGLMRARVEEEINTLSPALSALSEALDISTLDLLTASDRSAFLREAVERVGLPIEEVRRRILEAGAGAQEQLLALGVPETA